MTTTNPGIEMTTHCNYVLAFSDGSVKVGVTSRPRTRLSELCRSKKGAALVRGIRAPLCTKEQAFAIEAKLCSLLAYRAAPGAREWFTGGDAEFNFMRQTTGMLWHSICNRDRSAELEYREVTA